MEDDPEARRRAEKELEKREREQIMIGSVEDYMEDDQLSGEYHSRGQRPAIYYDG